MWWNYGYILLLFLYMHGAFSMDTEFEPYVVAFPALSVARVYCITEYERFTHEHAARHGSEQKTKKSLGYNKYTKDCRFFIYTAVPQSEWVKNPWYACHKYAMQDLAYKDHPLQNVSDCYDELRNLFYKKQTSNNSQESYIYKELIHFLQQYIEIMGKELNSNQSTVDYAHYVMNQEELMVCTETLKKFGSFLKDTQSELHIMPVVRHTYVKEENRWALRETRHFRDRYLSKDVSREELLQQYPVLAQYGTVTPPVFRYDASPSSSPESSFLELTDLVGEKIPNVPASKRYKLQ